MGPEPQLDAQDVINILTQQRNAALDEIVKMGAIIKYLEKQLKEAPPCPPTPSES
jgi:hypothetical protein